MKSRVYFIPVKETDTPVEVAHKTQRLVRESNIFDFVRKDMSVALKMHFGEDKNTGYVKPIFVRPIVDELNSRMAKTFLSDTNTLYKGRRTNSLEHLLLAHEHGFSPDAVAAPVIIPDDSLPENTVTIKSEGRFIREAYIARIFQDADILVGIAHFKGHIMTGFGGALKNIGMGTATREGKLAQHCDVSPVIVKSNCIGCAKCVAVCPPKAISIRNKKASIQRDECIGCATCIAVCEHSAIDVEWESGGSEIQERMVEYTAAALKDKKGSCAFLNFATKITKECDCLAQDDPRIAPDIGIFASTDPVSIDAASLEAVIGACGKDIFREVHPRRDGSRQLKHAARLGLGSLEYELIRL